MANYTNPNGVRETGRSFDKVDIIIDAFSQLRISGLTTQPVPEELDLALLRLEDMAAEWESSNITVGYQFEVDPDPNSPSGIQPAYKQAFVRNLALSLSPDFNIMVTPQLERLARGSFSNMQSQVALARLQEVQYPTRMARGSGNTLRWNRWNRFYRVQNSFFNSSNSYQMFIGDKDNYEFNFNSYLDDNETIKSFDLQLDTGLTLDKSSKDDDTVFFTVTANNPSNVTATSYGAQVTCIVKTSNDRVATRRLFFSLVPREINDGISTI